MTENEISGQIIDAAVKVHMALGPGLLESVYARALEFELQSRGLEIERERVFDVVYNGVILGDGFRADLVVCKKVIVELKSVTEVSKIHKKQLINYLKLSGLHLGLLINFNVTLLKMGIIRIVNNLED